MINVNKNDIDIEGENLVIIVDNDRGGYEEINIKISDVRSIIRDNDNKMLDELSVKF